MQDPGVSSTQSRVSRSNRIALCCLVLALAGFVAFHFLPWVPRSEGHFDGRVIWRNISGKLLSTSWDSRDLLATTGLLTGALVIVSGPFLLPVLRASRLAWWLFTVISALATIGLSGLLLFHIIANPYNSSRPPSLGVICIIVSQFLNLLGLCFIPQTETLSSCRQGRGRGMTAGATNWGSLSACAG